MTVDVVFAKLILPERDEDTEGFPWIRHNYTYDMETIENDGCSPDMTIFPGKPWRPYATLGFYNWMEQVSEAHELIEYTGRPDSNDLHLTWVTDKLLELVDALPDDGEPVNIDRAKWWKYWAHRSRELYGDSAVVVFF